MCSGACAAASLRLRKKTPRERLHLRLHPPTAVDHRVRLLVDIVRVETVGVVGHGDVAHLGDPALAARRVERMVEELQQ